MNSLLTIIVPCFNEEEVLPLFIDAITPVRAKLPCETELLFIDDGSSDRTLELLRSYASKDSSVRYVSFSRNFGKEAAILAGLKETKGDTCVLLDADLQHPPTLIPEMYRELTEGNYDSVAMYRDDRKKEGFFRRTFSSMFFKLINKMSKINLINGATDFRMMKRPMINAILSLPEHNRFSKGIFNWVGFNTKWLPFETAERPAGESKWSFGKLVAYSMDAILGFSEVPLKFFSKLGFFFCIMSFVLGLVFFVKTLIWGDPVAGFPTQFIMLLLLSGIMLCFLGVIGLYISRIYVELKGRPAYLVKETEKDNNSK
ncbi:MAG: glycosyltransferase family 2 protein [Lachnospiraceae bacterium]|nr:glycosyltransferase family 2 protein [Lachnospiraceae bacterium]